MENSNLPFLGTEAKTGGEVSMKKSTLVLLAFALLGAGGLAAYSTQAMSPSATPQREPAFMAQQKFPGKDSALGLLTHFGKNATILEPTMLYYINCLACYTCGENWYIKVAELNRGTYAEFGYGCSDPDHIEHNDNAYVCCAPR